MKPWLSLKGILRDNLGIVPGNFTIRTLLLPGDLDDPMSVRAALETFASNERKYARDETPYHWTARYEQTWTHIRVRVELKPKNQDAEQALNGGLKSTWKSAIESAWNGRYWARAGGELPCPLTFEVIWVESDSHHKVKVEAVEPGETGPRSNMTNWDTADPGATAAHEYGHMIGKFDEYRGGGEENREHLGTGTIMDTKLAIFAPRQFTRLVQDLGCFLCDDAGDPIPGAY